MPRLLNDEQIAAIRFRARVAALNSPGHSPGDARQAIRDRADLLEHLAELEERGLTALATLEAAVANLAAELEAE